MMIALLACVSPPASVVGPTVTQPSPLVPYARRIDWTLDRPVTVHLHASDGVHERDLDQGPSTSVSLPLIGLYPDDRWTVELTATDDRGRQLVAAPIVVETAPLGTPWPSMQLRVHEDDLEPGFTLLPLTAMGVKAWLVALDEDGEVAWLYDSGEEKILEARPTGDGGVRFLQGDELVEMDWLGNERRRLTSAPVPDDLPPGIPVAGAYGFGHELEITDDGTWVAISRESRTVPEFPASYDDPDEIGHQVEVTGDRVMEVDPDSGEVLRTWSTFDHLDPRRIGYGSLKADPYGFDWTHVNAVSTRGDDWLISVRHFDASLLVDATTGETEYILGTPDNWGPEWQDLLLEPVGTPFSWPWHQHGVKQLEDGKVLMLDNGNYRASPWTGEPLTDEIDNWSRVVEYQVDPVARTVRQLWEFQLDPTVFSGAMGDADPLPGGHVLATFAYVSYEGHVVNDDLGRHRYSVRVVEFDPATSRVVWDLDAWAPIDDHSVPAWQSFRAERFRSFD
jgi:hypothetical protein